MLCVQLRLLHELPILKKNFFKYCLKNSNIIYFKFHTRSRYDRNHHGFEYGINIPSLVRV
jgi:hypothetical protein